MGHTSYTCAAMQDHMELKDLTDSDLQIMGEAYDFLILCESLSIDDLRIHLRRKGLLSSDAVDQESIRLEEREKAHSILLLLADWEFAAKNGIVMNEWHFKFTKFKHSHRRLRWHRDRAIKQHALDVANEEKQKRHDRLQRSSIRLGMVFSLLAIVVTVTQWIDSRGSRSDIERLEADLKQVQYKIDNHLLDASSTTIHPSMQSTHPSTQAKDSSRHNITDGDSAMLQRDEPKIMPEQR